MFSCLITLLFFINISIRRIEIKLSNKKKQRILNVLYVVKVKLYLKTLKITRVQSFTIKNIKVKITNILKSQQFINYIKHIDNVQLQKL